MPTLRLTRETGLVHEREVSVDATQFDRLTRGFFAAASRRRTVGALLAGTLGPLGAPLAEARKNRKKQRKRKRKHRKQKRRNRPCYPGKACLPGPGKDNAGCDFTASVRFFDLDVSGSDLSQTNLTGAQLAGADLRSSNLGGACLVGANLLNASIDSSTNLDGAIFCRTLMPDGSFNDDGCDKGTRCCPTPASCADGTCAQAPCENHYFGECSVIGFPSPYCCEPFVCTPSIFAPVLTRCQVPCEDDAYCRRTVGGNSRCMYDFIFCPFIGPCCQIP